MSAKIINGTEISKNIKKRIKENLTDLKQKYDIVPGLCVIIVGNDAASQVYVHNKEKACIELGFYSELIKLSADITEDDLLDIIRKKNQDKKIHGLLVQLPLPKHISQVAIIEAISIHKDVDGFSVNSMGSLFLDKQSFIPCTPKGCIALLEEIGIDIVGKHAVIVGRSNIVGKPLALLLLQKNATVTICHSKTHHLSEITRQADILIAAIGKAHFIKKDMIKKNAIILDIGINRGKDGKLYGDVNTQEAMGIASYITPVPGGVGPMTIAMLMQNTLQAAKKCIME